MPVTSKSSHFYLKGHLRVCWVIWVIFQLQRTAIENATIDTIDTINTIDIMDWINQYEDNQSDQLTLQNTPNQLYHCCFFFRFYWLIKVRSIVVLHPVSSCWYDKICLLFCFCLPLNLTVAPTAEVRLISQRGMGYCCVYHGQIFLTVFLLLK